MPGYEGSEAAGSPTTSGKDTEAQLENLLRTSRVYHGTLQYTLDLLEDAGLMRLPLKSCGTMRRQVSFSEP